LPRRASRRVSRHSRACVVGTLTDDLGTAADFASPSAELKPHNTAVCSITLRHVTPPLEVARFRAAAKRTAF
jgi:hypothetical protein